MERLKAVTRILIRCLKIFGWLLIFVGTCLFLNEFGNLIFLPKTETTDSETGFLVAPFYQLLPICRGVIAIAVARGLELTALCMPLDLNRHSEDNFTTSLGRAENPPEKPPDSSDLMAHLPVPSPSFSLPTQKLATIVRIAAVVMLPFGLFESAESLAYFTKFVLGGSMWAMLYLSDLTSTFIPACEGLVGLGIAHWLVLLDKRLRGNMEF